MDFQRTDKRPRRITLLRSAASAASHEARPSGAGQQPRSVIRADERGDGRSERALRAPTLALMNGRAAEPSYWLRALRKSPISGAGAPGAGPLCPAWCGAVRSASRSCPVRATPLFRSSAARVLPVSRRCPSRSSPQLFPRGFPSPRRALPCGIWGRLPKYINSPLTG